MAICHKEIKMNGIKSLFLVINQFDLDTYTKILRLESLLKNHLNNKEQINKINYFFVLKKERD